MATTFVLTRPDVFVSGVVAAYVKPALGVPASGAPSGSAVSSPSVVGNSVTFTGLADNTQYIAYQGSPDRYVSFRTTPASTAVAETDPVAEADLATHAALTTTAHGGLIAPAIVDAKGDLIVGSAADTVVRKPVGTNGQVLSAQSAQTGGLLWVDPPAATALRRLPILGWQTRPDDTGDCYPEPFDILATNDVWKQMILRFGASNSAAPTLRAGVFGNFAVPKTYTQDATLVIVWAATLTSGDVVWDFDYRTVAGNDTTSLDQSGTEGAVTVTDTAPGAALRRLEVTIDLTDADFTADDTVEFFLARDGVDAADTMAGSALLFNLFFQYTG